MSFSQGAQSSAEVGGSAHGRVLLLRTAEQIYDIPVPCRGGGGGRGGSRFTRWTGFNSFFWSRSASGLAVFCLSEPVVEYIAPAPVAFCRTAGPGGGLQDFRPTQGSTSFEGLGGGLQDVLPLQGSTTLCRDGGGGGLQIFSEDRVPRRFAEMEDLVVVFKTLSQDRVHQRLGEQMIWKTLSGAPTRCRRFWAQVEEEEAEEEDEEMDQGHLRPRRYCAFILRGVHFRALGQGDGCPVIMQLEFQQSVLFFF